MSLYASFPELEVDRLFTTAETGMLSGYSPELQRRYDSNGTAVFLAEKIDQKHRRNDWEDVCRWSLMYEVASYGFDVRSAAFFAASFSQDPKFHAVRKRNGIWTENVHPHSSEQLLYHDFRITDARSEPLFVHCFPELGQPESFLNTTSSGPQGVSLGEAGNAARRHDGRFGFWMNYSEWQRRLLLRYESIR